MEKETYLENILKKFIDDSLDSLMYNPCNSDWEFSMKTYEETMEKLFELIIEEKPDMPFTFIKNYLKWTN